MRFKFCARSAASKIFTIEVATTHIILSSTNFDDKILSKIKPTATLLQFADGVLKKEWKKRGV